MSKPQDPCRQEVLDIYRQLHETLHKNYPDQMAITMIHLPKTTNHPGATLLNPMNVTSDVLDELIDNMMEQIRAHTDFTERKKSNE